MQFEINVKAVNDIKTDSVLLMDFLNMDEKDIELFLFKDVGNEKEKDVSKILNDPRLSDEKGDLLTNSITATSNADGIIKLINLGASVITPIKRKRLENHTPLELLFKKFIIFESVLKHLINKKLIDPNMEFSDGSTPFNKALQNLNTTMVEKLIDANADINKLDSKGRHPLFFANEENAKKLLKTGIDVNKPINEKNDTFLHRADTMLGKLLIAAKADINAVNKDGFKPIETVRETFANYLFGSYYTELEPPFKNENIKRQYESIKRVIDLNNKVNNTTLDTVESKFLIFKSIMDKTYISNTFETNQLIDFLRANNEEFNKLSDMKNLLHVFLRKLSPSEYIYMLYQKDQEGVPFYNLLLSDTEMLSIAQEKCITYAKLLNKGISPNVKLTEKAIGNIVFDTGRHIKPEEKVMLFNKLFNLKRDTVEFIDVMTKNLQHEGNLAKVVYSNNIELIRYYFDNNNYKVAAACLNTFLQKGGLADDLARNSKSVIWDIFSKMDIANMDNYLMYHAMAQVIYTTDYYLSQNRKDYNGAKVLTHYKKFENTDGTIVNHTLETYLQSVGKSSVFYTIILYLIYQYPGEYYTLFNNHKTNVKNVLNRIYSWGNNIYPFDYIYLNTSVWHEAVKDIRRGDPRILAIMNFCDIINSK